jgi:Zn finger protein HypA/HybF involved in hydrogenase expression
MHEYSIVQVLLTQCESYEKANDAEKLTRVEIKVG